MRVLSNLEPKNVFQYFEDICAIPHGSGNTDAISAYIVDFAKKNDLTYVTDRLGNVIIYKCGSKGYENAPAVVLQGHMDMVCEKNYELASKFNFKKDGLKLEVSDEYVYAKGTTLGGDDGIAVAYMLALLAGDYEHPPIECVFTVDEEVGMDGALALDPSYLKGRILLNLDNEEQGEILTSCAGGSRVICRVPVRYCEMQGVRCNLVICGLAGGHSGTEIDKYHGNANLLMGRMLHFIGKQIHYDICALSGGLQDNAIPRESNAQILVNEQDVEKLEGIVAEYEKIIQNEYRATEHNITIYCETFETVQKAVLTPKTRERAVFLLMTIPDGIQKMSMDTEHLVQTSSNAGIMRLQDDYFELIVSVRSSITSEKIALRDKIQYLTETIGGKYTVESDYPAWEYKEDSPLRRLVFEVYQQQFGKNPHMTGIHAGLECGIFCEKIPDMDMVSFGPTIEAIHTPKEKLDIRSTQETWEFLLNILKALKKK
ncbi:MAG: aminoacyl-histidine dipeptidase [Lachnospiraceae bacterium]|nr:aminoacyl-histidine dipeptidase [Lachnospiraceae bacterium]